MIMNYCLNFQKKEMMMDIADAAYLTEQLEFRQFLSKAKYEFRAGPQNCTKCGEYNDRSSSGYCICSECMGDPLALNCGCKN